MTWVEIIQSLAQIALFLTFIIDQDIRPSVKLFLLFWFTLAGSFDLLIPLAIRLINLLT